MSTPAGLLPTNAFDLDRHAVRYLCPLPDCHWRYDKPPFGADLTAVQIEDPAFMEQTRRAVTQHLQDTEDALSAHVKTHPPLEWFKALHDLKNKVRRMQSHPPLTAEVSYECAYCGGPGDRADTYDVHYVEHTPDCPYNQNPPPQTQ